LHLSLTDTKWGLAAQVALGTSLKNWLVHNTQDEKVGDWLLACCLQPMNQARDLAAPV
jgi:hypothetical protein